METYDEPGKLRKQCDQCKKYVHSRTTVCACGNAFPKKDKVETPVEPAATVRKILIRIDTPAGTCPIKLVATDQETVDNWSQRLLQQGVHNGLDYTTKALKYFVRHFYEYGSENHYKACVVLDDLNPGNDRSVTLTPIVRKQRNVEFEFEPERPVFHHSSAPVVAAEEQTSRPIQASDDEIVM